MLTEERHRLILNELNIKKSLSVSELCSLLEASESTVRRDLNYLAERGLLVKVHGGAMSLSDRFSNVEQDIEEKSRLYK